MFNINIFLTFKKNTGQNLFFINYNWYFSLLEETYEDDTISLPRRSKKYSKR